MQPTTLHALTHPARRFQAGAHFVALTLDADSSVTEHWVQILPSGEFRARDGRPEKIAAWKCDASIAAALIEAFRAQATQMVIDYEHQTLHAEDNGQPAPAAGWITDLTWREDEGLFGRVDWTERARAAIRGQEYRYFSPVFTSDDKTGAVTQLLMGAITNFPGLDGMLPIAARSLATDAIEEPAMNPVLAALIAALGLPADTTEDQAVATVNALKGLDAVKLRKQLGLAADADGAAILAGVDALSAKTPDPAKFVPASVVEALKSEIAMLSGNAQADSVEALVSEGLKDGRLHAAQEQWARDLGKANVAALKGYLQSAQPIAALSSTQTRGKAPVVDTGEHGLTHEELAVCRRTGIEPEAYAKTKSKASA